MHLHENPLITAHEEISWLFTDISMKKRRLEFLEKCLRNQGTKGHDLGLFLCNKGNTLFTVVGQRHQLKAHRHKACDSWFDSQGVQMEE